MGVGSLKVSRKRVREFSILRVVWTWLLRDPNGLPVIKLTGAAGNFGRLASPPERFCDVWRLRRGISAAQLMSNS